MRVFLICLAVLPVLVLIATAGGAVHPLGDSLAVFRFQIGILAALTSLILYRYKPSRYSGAAVMLSVAASGAIWYYGIAPKEKLQAQNTLYQKNLSFRLRDTGPIIADIKSKNPDFVTLQEVSKKNLTILKALQSQLPSQHFCRFSTVGGVAVASRYPVVEGSRICSEKNGLAAMQVTAPSGPVWVVSLHLHWPFPFSQAAQVKHFVSVLQSLDGPVVLGGDFNMVPWSYTMTQIEEATRTRRVGHVNGTFLLENLIYIPIDHVLVSGACKNGQVSTLDLLGSDHHGVLAGFNLTC